MKTFILTLLLIVSFTLSAQDTPKNYDGGSELQKAILKARNKDLKSSKEASKKNDAIYKKVVVYIPETRDEKLYRLINGHSSPKYVRRVMASKEYKEIVAENQRTEKERMTRWRERMKRDSIIKLQEQDSIRKIQAKLYIKMQRRIDSTEKARELKRKKYIEKMKRKN